VLGREGRRPAADLVVLVSVGQQHADDEFFVLPIGVLYADSRKFAEEWTYRFLGAALSDAGGDDPVP
jgi:hypothetical protein